jgi:hypothetical protein
MRLDMHSRQEIIKAHYRSYQAATVTVTVTEMPHFKM